MQKTIGQKFLPFNFAANLHSNHSDLDPDQKQRVVFLFRGTQVLALVVGCAIFLFLYKLLFETDSGADSDFSGEALIISIIVESFLFLALYWISIGHAKWAITLVSFSLLASIGYGAVYIGNGLYDPAVHIIYLILLLVSVFQSKRLPFIITSVSCALVVILFFLTQRGLINSEAEIPEIEDVVIILISLIGSYLLLRATLNQLIQSTNQLEQQSKQLKMQSVELIDYQNKLEEKVEKRTAQLLVERDKAESASRAKSEFLAQMSHELRTPLNAIIGYTELIADELQPEEPVSGALIEPDLGRINYSARHLLELINNVLDLSKIEAERLDLNIGTHDIAELVEQLSETVRPIVQKQNNLFEVELDLQDTTITTDSSHLKQILLNLLNNAGKFTSNGTVTFRICEASNDDKFCFEIIDSGIGIEEKFLGTLFEPFSQEQNSFNRSHDGTGLGLAISQHLTNMLGGTIEVETQKGTGSLFRILIPKIYTPKLSAQLNLQAAQS